MSDQKVLVLLGNAAHLQLYLKKMLARDVGAIFFTDDRPAQRELDHLNLPWLSTEQLFEMSELDSLAALAVQLHETWLTSSPELTYRGLPISTALIQFYEPWARIVRKIRLYRRLLEKVRPQRIVSYFGEVELLRQIKAVDHEIIIEAPPIERLPWQALSTSWIADRIRYRGGLRGALRFYADYWWSETPLLKIPINPVKIPKGQILFIAGYINHAKTFLPVLRQIRKPYLVLASDPDTCQFFRQQGIVYCRLGHFVTPSMWRGYQANRRWLRKHQKELAVGVEREILNDNIALLPFVQSDLSRLLRHHLARLRLYTDVYLELFQHSQPGHVVVADDTTTQGRIAVLAAQSLSIPTLNIQHGAIADVQHYRYAIADIFAVWGERDRELLVRHGVPKEKTVITGQPRFDDLGRQTNNTATLRQHLDIPASHKLILWATTPFVPRVSYDFPDRNRRYLQALLELLACEPSWSLVIKLHPRDQRAYYETALTEVEPSVRSCVRILQEEDVQQLLLIADVLLAWNTSVIQEAVLMKKSIIGLNFFAFPEAIPSVSEGVALPARHAEELSQALRSVFANDESTLAAMVEARQKYIARHLKADERTAVERILELIGAKTV